MYCNQLLEHHQAQNQEYFHPRWNSISCLVWCIFDINDNISHFTKKRGHVCLLLEDLVFLLDKQDSLCFSYCCNMSTCVSHHKYVILIINSHLLSVCTTTHGKPPSQLFTSLVCLFRRCSWALLQSSVNKQLGDLQATSGLALIIRVSGCWWN